MMVLLIVTGLIIVAAAVRLSLPVLKRHRVSWELRRDWWPRFEREFRAYASASWQNAREAERRS